MTFALIIIITFQVLCPPTFIGCLSIMATFKTFDLEALHLIYRVSTVHYSPLFHGVRLASVLKHCDVYLMTVIVSLISGSSSA